MWRTHTTKQGRQILHIARRQLASESTPQKPNPPPGPKPNLPPPIPPPPPKSGGSAFLKFFGLGLPAAAGGTLGYAWYDQDFRKQLEDNVPYAKEVLENILPSKEEAPPKSQWTPPASAPSGLEKATKLNVQEQQTQTPASNTLDLKFPRRSGDFSYEYENDEEKVLDVEDPQVLSDQCKSRNLLDIAQDYERRISQEILEQKISLMHDLTAPDPMINQAYTPYDMRRIEASPWKQLDQESIKDIAPSLQKQTEVNKQDEPLKKPESRAIDPKAVTDRLKKKEEEEKADNAALEVALHKLLKNSKNLAEEATKAQHDAAATIRNHTKLLKQAMDDTADILQKDAQWEAVAIAFKEREQAAVRASELTSQSKKSIEKLRDVIAESKNNKVTKSNKAIVPATKEVNDMLKEMGSAATQVRQAEAEANVMQKYKDLVDKGKKQFQKELESLMPDVKLGSGKKLTEAELNSLIAHAHRRIEQLQRQIAEQLAMERQRLSAALEAQRQEDRKNTSAAVADERMRLREEFEVEKQTLELDFLEQLELEVRRQLARQAAAHSDHLKDVLAVQQQQLSTEFSRELNVKLLEEREKFQTEVAGWISRLRGIEAAIDARASSEQLVRSAQDLWLACISLNSILLFGDDEKELVPVKDKVKAILKAGKKHPFVEIVANSFPQEALETGVSTEDRLRKRFYRVNRICRRLGLVQEPNTSLYKYLISFIHSLVVLDDVSATNENDQIDLNSLDNFELLAYARYWMEQGKLDLAVRFMNQLTGEPGRAAGDWIDDARIYLETKQAAHTLSAYASATGLANTF